MRKILFTVALAAALVGCNNSGQVGSNSVSFDDVIKTRRSVRSYDATKTIGEAEVRELLLSAQEAPSWANQQPTKYYVAQSAAMIDSVKNYIGGNRRNVEGAPVLIVSTFERGKSGFFNGNPANELGDLWGAYDNGLANAYLVLKARAMGFDTLIMGMRDADALRRLFGIPESETITAVISLGYRSGEPRQPQHKNLDDIVKFF
jgi:nitroreductase